MLSRGAYISAELYREKMNQEESSDLETKAKHYAICNFERDSETGELYPIIKVE